MRSRLLAFAVVASALAMAEEPAFRLEIVERGGRRSSVPIASERCDKGAWRCRVPRGRIPPDARGFSIRCSWATASAGECGWWMGQRGDVGGFLPEVTNGFNIASHPWVWLPYYAMKTPRHTFIAVLDGLRHELSIRMAVSNGLWEAYPAYPVAALGFPLYEDAELTVYELPGDADYNEMAKTYRRHRERRDPTIRPMKVRMKDSPYLAQLARSLAMRRMHAIKPGGKDVDYTPEDEPAVKLRCTFADTLAVLGELKKAGVDDVALCVSGWQTGGYDGRCPSAFPVEPACGGEDELRRLVAGGQKLGYLIDAHDNFTDAFSCSPAWANGAVACKNPAGGLDRNGVWAGGRAYNLCLRNAWATFVPEQLRKTADIGFRGCHYVDVFTATSPYRCCDPAHPANRADQRKVAGDVLGFCRSLFGGVASEMCMDDLIGRIDYMNYASTSLKYLARAREGGKSFRAQKVVPFYELAYHDVCLATADRWTQGYVEGDAKLKNIEFGGRPILYAFDRKKIPEVKRIYDEFVTYRHLLVEEMTRHVEIFPGVFRTSYANGESTVVNYTEKPVSVDRRTIPAKGWRLFARK